MFSPIPLLWFLGGRATESLLSIIHDLGGHDTDLRQQNVANTPSNDVYGFLKRISAIINKQDSAESYSEQQVEYNSILPQIKNFLNASHVENVQSPKLEVNASCLPYSSDVSASEVDIDHAQHLKVRISLKILETASKISVYAFGVYKIGVLFSICICGFWISSLTVTMAQLLKQ